MKKATHLNANEVQSLFPVEEVVSLLTSHLAVTATETAIRKLSTTPSPGNSSPWLPTPPPPFPAYKYPYSHMGAKSHQYLSQRHCGGGG